MQVICSQWALAEPATYDVEPVVYEGGCVAVSTHGWTSVRLFRLDPHVLLRVENAQTRMVFLPVVAAEHPQFAFVERGSMIFDLRRIANDGTQCSL